MSEVILVIVVFLLTTYHVTGLVRKIASLEIRIERLEKKELDK